MLAGGEYQEPINSSESTATRLGLEAKTFLVFRREDLDAAYDLAQSDATMTFEKPAFGEDGTLYCGGGEIGVAAARPGRKGHGGVLCALTPDGAPFHEFQRP